MKTQIEHVEDLKNQISAGNVSVLVGAGMSKNVSKEKYPSWSELLKDAVQELYGEMILYEYGLVGGGSAADPAFEEFRQRRITQLTNEKGYLRVVSEYIERYGYSESIATYIEARTPFAVIKDGKLLLRTGAETGTQAELSTDLLALHRKLLALRWNNIYTTNYDNLLEICVDTRIEKRLRKRVKQIRKEIADTDATRKKSVEELGKLQSELELIQGEQEKSGNETGQQSTISVSRRIASVEDARKDVVVPKTEAHLKDDIFLKTRVNVEYDRQIDERLKRLTETVMLLDECYAVVDHSSKLGLKRNRNIIKLHGNLREGSSSPFGFDGDLRSHYVISAKDYEQYPARHEAFTQLMRISLLQQCFCVVGFSGDDGNFQAWVSWVRDVIERRTADDNEKRVKVYFIDLSGKQLSPAKQLFFENHQIQNLQLQDPHVLAHLSQKIGRQIDGENPRDLLDAWLDYLLDERIVDRPRVAVELLEQEKYRKFWQSLPHLQLVKEERIDLSAHRYPAKYKRTNRIPPDALTVTSGQDNILRWADRYMAAVVDKKEFGRLLVRAAEDYHIPASSVYFGNETLSDEFRRQWREDRDPEFSGYLMALLKDAVWRRDRSLYGEVISALEAHRDFDGLRDDITYHKALFCAFGLDFQGLREILDAWTPVGISAVRKAGLTALYDENNARSVLMKALPLPLLQDQLYGLSLLKLLRISLEGRFPVDVAEKIKLLKSEGLNDPQDGLDAILRTIQGGEKSVEPLGEDKFRGKSFVLNKASKEVSSVQFLGVQFEIAMPFAGSYVVTRNHREMYTVLHHSFYLYPHVAVFVLAQYQEEKFLRRLGQEFALCEDIDVETLKDIVDTIYRAYASEFTPARVKEALLVFSSTLIVAVDPAAWYDLFDAAWRRRSTNKSELSVFIKSALGYIRDPKLFQRVISDSLDLAGKAGATDQEMSNAMSSLYHLAGNDAFYRATNLADGSIAALIDQTIDRLSQQTWRAMFLLGNIKHVLNDQQRDRIKSILRDFPYANIQNSQVWRTFLVFAEGDHTIVEKIAEVVSRQPRIWHSGVTGRQVSSLVDFVPLHQLRYAARNRLGIRWSEEQLIRMYKTLVVELRAMVEMPHDVNWHDELLLEMQLFLLQERDVLRDQEGYDDVLGRVSEWIDTKNGFTDLSQCILSSHQKNVLSGLRMLSMGIQHLGGINDERARLIELVLKKVLFQAEPGLSASLRHLSSWFGDFPADPHLRVMESLAVDVLARYREGLPADVDVPFVWEQLFRVALVVSAWGNDSDTIKWYKGNVSTFKYNNVNLLRQKDI